MRDEQCAVGRHVRRGQCRKFCRETLILKISRNGLRVLAEEIASGGNKLGVVCLAQNDLWECHDGFEFSAWPAAPTCLLASPRPAAASGRRPPRKTRSGACRQADSSRNDGSTGRP